MKMSGQYIFKYVSYFKSSIIFITLHGKYNRDYAICNLCISFILYRLLVKVLRKKRASNVIAPKIVLRWALCYYKIKLTNSACSLLWLTVCV